MNKWEQLAERVKERKQAQLKEERFPSPTALLSEEDQMALSSIQSRAMKAWWSVLTIEQRKEIGRRISEGHARNKANSK
jgi:hypothetical protein